MNLAALLLCWFLLPAAALAASQPVTAWRLHAEAKAVRLHGLIRLDVSVAGATGRAAEDLPRSDFTVLDNGKPVPIVAFAPPAAERDSPLNIVLVLDTRHAGPRLAAVERDQVLRFLLRNGGELPYPVRLCTVDRQGMTLLTRSSRDGNLLADSLRLAGEAGPQVRSAGAGQAASGTIPPPEHFQYAGFHGVGALGVIAGRLANTPGRKIVVWIAPARVDDPAAGPVPVRSKRAQQYLLGRILWFSGLLRETRVAIDVIPAQGGARAPHRSASARKAGPGESAASASAPRPLSLNELARQSGGRVLAARGDIADEIGICIRDGSTFYSITFNPRPTARANDFHSIEVRVARPGLTARTTAGYYDQPFYSDAASPKLRPVTAAELEQMIHADPRHAAGRFAELRMTQRLSFARLIALTDELHKSSAQQKLLGLADQAAFCPPSPQNVLHAAPPSFAVRQQILARTAHFLMQELPRWPEFAGTRQAILLTNAAGHESGDAGTSLRVQSDITTNILYSRGAAVAQSKQLWQAASPVQQLRSFSSFQPLLHTVRDALEGSGSIRWARWERIDGRRSAVFAFRIPRSESMYEVSGCCVLNTGGQENYSEYPPDRGGFAVDPASGAILRVWIGAGLRDFVPVQRSTMEVDYGRVMVDGQPYWLPAHSVSLWRGRSILTTEEWDLPLQTWGPYVTRIEDYTFSHYRMLRPASASTR